MSGSHCIKTWSTTKNHITLSSGEAELVACVKMCTELLGIVQLLADWGSQREAKVYVDSTAAISATQRRGNGKLRHVKVGMLWVQEIFQECEMTVCKVLGTENPAEAMTKHLSGRRIMELMQKMNQQPKEGRADLSLQSHMRLALFKFECVG